MQLSLLETMYEDHISTEAQPLNISQKYEHEWILVEHLRYLASEYKTPNLSKSLNLLQPLSIFPKYLYCKLNLEKNTYNLII